MSSIEGSQYFPFTGGWEILRTFNWGHRAPMADHSPSSLLLSPKVLRKARKRLIRGTAVVVVLLDLDACEVDGLSY